MLPLIPKALLIPNFTALNTANRQLKREISEKQIAEAALKESENRFRSMFEYAAIGIAFLDLEGKIISANPAYKNMIGYSENEIQNQHFTNYTYAEDIAGDLENFKHLVSGKCNYYQRSKRYLTKEEQIVWGNLTVSLVRDQNGEPQYVISMVENITERKQAEEELLETKESLENLLKARTDQILQMNEELSWQANHDALTGLVNRYEFERRLAKAVNSVQYGKLNNTQSGLEHTLFYLNLDRFKVVNDTCGHLAGDELLRQISQILQKRCRQTDTLARLGGDEFALLLYKCPLEKGEEVAYSLLKNIQEFRFIWENHTFPIGVSIGLVPINSSSPDSEEILMAADAACYAAKSRGRSRVHVYHPDDQGLAQYRSEAQWVGRIEEAIKQDHFCLYYQSILPLKTSLPEHSKHYEVLLRLSNGKGEIISPGAFLPAAERYNLMSNIDTWVISRFFAFLAKHLNNQTQTKNNYFSGLYTLNLSGESINDDNLLYFIQKQFEIYPIPPEMICFEITETVAVANLNRAAQIIQEIRAMGCKIALDDFGSGMSSFGYLKYLPVDYLKIDGGFVKDIAEDTIDFAMVEAINRIGQVMGIKTIAEYVANETILEKIRTIGVDYAQGYGISMPQPLY